MKRVMLIACLLSLCTYLTGQRLASVDQAIAQERIFQDIPGIALGVIQKGKIVHLGAYGYHDENYKKRLTIDTDMPWASISKTLTAVAIWQLIEEGKIDTATTIGEIPELSYYLDDSSPFYADKARMTIGKLLSHRSRMPHYDIDEYASTDRRKYSDTKSRWNAMQSVNVFKNLPLLGHDTTRYSSFAYNLLGAVVEEVDGSFIKRTDAIADAIGIPWFGINIKSQGWGKTCGDPEEVAKGDFRYTLPAGGFQSNIRELTTLIQSIFWGKKLLQNASAMWTPIADNDIYRYGVYEETYRTNTGSSLTVISHGGTHSNAINYFGYMPSEDAAIVILTNSGYTNRRRIFRAVADAIRIPLMPPSGIRRIACDSDEKEDESCPDDFFLLAHRNSSRASMIRRNYRYNAFYEEIKDLRKSNYQCVDVEVYVDKDGLTRWDGVFEQSSRERKINRNLKGRAKFLEKVSYWEDRGYYPVDIEVYQIGGSYRWAALFEKGKAVVETRLTTRQFEAKHDDLTGKKYQLVELEPYTEGKMTYFAAIWRKGAFSKVELKRTKGQLIFSQIAMNKQGYRLHSVEPYNLSGTTYYASIWLKNVDNAFDFYTPCELGDAFPSSKKQIIDFERLSSNL